MIDERNRALLRLAYRPEPITTDIRFHRELEPLASRADLDPDGREIIECCLADGGLSDYVALMPDD